MAGIASGLLFPPSRAGTADMSPRVFKSRKQTAPITPVEEFYVEDISGPPASLKRGPQGWRLAVNGKVDNPLVLDYARVLARPSVKRIITLSCIGNPVGGHAMGTAEWEGIPLGELIKESGPHFFAGGLVFKGEDGYQDAIPLKHAFHPGALLAYKMNGQPLPLEHGFPLRLLVPGYFGIKQAKWVREIEAVRDAPQGYWQKRGWSEKAKVKVFSRIDWPENGEWLFARSAALRGVAFAGDRGIQYVEVSADGEKTWTLADLSPPLSEYAWTLWSFTCAFPKAGVYRLAVRAADRYSGRQEEGPRDPFPSGASGIHRIEVNVA